jgi:hypothetical protein
MKRFSSIDSPSLASALSIAAALSAALRSVESALLTGLLLRLN